MDEFEEHPSLFLSIVWVILASIVLGVFLVLMWYFLQVSDPWYYAPGLFLVLDMLITILIALCRRLQRVLSK